MPLPESMLEPVCAATRRYYDELAPRYDQHVPDWDGAIARQASVLDGVITERFGTRPVDILDCTCGVGTQAIGLAALGHRVVGTDISAKAVREARRHALRHGVDVAFDVCFSW